MEIKIIWRKDLRYEIAKQKRKQVSNSEVKRKKKYNHQYTTLLVVQTCSLTYTELGGKASPNSSSNADSRVAGHRKTREHNSKCIHPTKILKQRDMVST